jgi:hypothetical protein
MKNWDQISPFFQQIKGWSEFAPLMDFYATYAPAERFLWQLETLELSQEMADRIAGKIVQRLRAAPDLMRVYNAGHPHKRAVMGVHVQREISYAERVKLLKECLFTHEGLALAMEYVNLFGVKEGDRIEIEKLLLKSLANLPKQALTCWSVTEHLMKRHMTIEERSRQMLIYAEADNRRYLPDVMIRISRVPLTEAASWQLHAKWREYLLANPDLLFPPPGVISEGMRAKCALARATVTFEKDPHLYDQILRAALACVFLLPHHSKAVAGLIQRSSGAHKEELLILCYQYYKTWTLLHLHLFDRIPEQIGFGLEQHFETMVSLRPGEILDTAVLDNFENLAYSRFELAKKMLEGNPEFVLAMITHFRLQADESLEIQRFVRSRRH